MAFDAGPMATENQFPCQTLEACLGTRLHGNKIRTKRPSVPLPWAPSAVTDPRPQTPPPPPELRWTTHPLTPDDFRVLQRSCHGWGPHHDPGPCTPHEGPQAAQGRRGTRPGTPGRARRGRRVRHRPTDLRGTAVHVLPHAPPPQSPSVPGGGGGEPNIYGSK